MTSRRGVFFLSLKNIQIIFRNPLTNCPGYDILYMKDSGKETPSSGYKEKS